MTDDYLHTYLGCGVVDGAPNKSYVPLPHYHVTLPYVPPRDERPEASLDGLWPSARVLSEKRFVPPDHQGGWVFRTPCRE